MVAAAPRIAEREPRRRDLGHALADLSLGVIEPGLREREVLARSGLRQADRVAGLNELGGDRLVRRDGDLRQQERAFDLAAGLPIWS